MADFFIIIVFRMLSCLFLAAWEMADHFALRLVCYIFLCFFCHFGSSVMVLDCIDS